MSEDQTGFSIRATAAGIAKGLLAIPRKHRHLFPTEIARITLVFDDENKGHVCTFRPYDAKAKEARVYGLGRWYADRDVLSYEIIHVQLEDPETWRYRIMLPRYVNSKRVRLARERLYEVETDDEATAQLKTIAEITKKRYRNIAIEELMALSETPTQPRRRGPASGTPARETVPAPLRVLLAAAHDAKCQVCGFAFLKTDGTPYFELHHIEPECGHHPYNLLLLCANCHAQFEWARIEDMEFLAGWPVAIRINGKRFAIRQPLLPKGASNVRTALQLIALQIVGFGWCGSSWGA